MTDAAVDIPPTESRWWEYIEGLRASNGLETAMDVAKKLDLPHSTVYAWQKKHRANSNSKIDSETARLVAYTFERPVLEVFFNAGLLAREDVPAGDNSAAAPLMSTDNLTDDALLQELQRRIKQLRTEAELLRAERPESAKPEEAKSRGRRSTTRVARRPEARS